MRARIGKLRLWLRTPLGQTHYNLLYVAARFSQIISFLPHADLTNLTKNARASLVLSSGWLALGKADSESKATRQLCVLCASA